MKDVLYIANTCSRVFASMMTDKNIFAERSWSSEYTRRLASHLLEVGAGQDADWLRRKQNLLAMKGPALLQVQSERERIDGVSCIRVQPKNQAHLPRKVLYFHGGGYVVGSARSYHYTFAKLALSLNAEVVGVDYSLAPEHPVESAIEEAIRVYEVIEDMEPTQQLILMGDSAGAGLVLALVLQLLERQLLRPNTECVLISPWVDPARSELLDKDLESGDILNEAMLNNWFEAVRTAGSCEESVRFLSRNWQGFPKTYVQAGGQEMFRSQIEQLVADMKRDGVDVSLDVFPGQFHVFQTFAPLVTETDQAWQKMAVKVGAVRV